jgi:uncharacterized cupin superfamily protein
VTSIEEPLFDEQREQPGFLAHRARVSRQLGCELLGASLWEVPPGETAYPFHYHLAQEELLFVLRGRPLLRTPEGWRQLEQGEAVVFPVGERGAHQLVNRTQEPVRFLAISNQATDVVVYPDSDKVAAFECVPQGGGLRLMFRSADAVDYYEGEVPPSGADPPSRRE